MSGVVVDPEIVAWRRRTVIDMTAKGCSAAQISAVLRITERSVVRHRKAAGITQGRCGERPSEGQLAQAVEMLDDGCSYAEVGRTLGIRVDTVKRLFPGKGWTRQQCAEHSAVLRRCRVQMRRHEGVFIK